MFRFANTDKATLESAIREFGEKASNAEVAVVYYTGHGIGAAGNHYLIPVDAQFGSTADIAAAVPLDLVMRSLEPASVLRLILLDAMFEEQQYGRK